MIGFTALAGGPALRRSSARSILCHRPHLLPPGRDPRLVPLAGLAGRELHARPDPVHQQIRPGQGVPAPNPRQMTSVIPQHQSAIDLWPGAAYRHTNLVGPAVGLAMAGGDKGLDIGAVALGGERLQHWTRPDKAPSW